MKIEYVKVGDYYLPNLTLPEEKREIGRWGMLRKVYMKEYKAGRYNYLLLTGKLDSYLADLNEQAWELADRLEAQMKDAEGVTEELKAENPMEWVRHCNNIRNRVSVRDVIWLLSLNLRQLTTDRRRWDTMQRKSCTNVFRQTLQRNVKKNNLK